MHISPAADSFVCCILVPADYCVDKMRDFFLIDHLVLDEGCIESKHYPAITFFVRRLFALLVLFLGVIDMVNDFATLCYGESDCGQESAR